jgi:hypothetical protein
MEDVVIEELPDSHDDIVGVRASGVLTDADYKQTLFPLLVKTIAEHGKARLLVEIADSFAAWKLDAAWDDAVFGFAHRADFSRIAIVGGPKGSSSNTILGSRTSARDRERRQSAVTRNRGPTEDRAARSV